MVTGNQSSTIGQSIYKTITQGDAEIYEAQMLLQFSYHVDHNENGHRPQSYSEVLSGTKARQMEFQILSDLKDRR